MIPTPHITAKKEDFAKTVLMPGDPKRSKYIATNFLSDSKLVNDVRGIQGYTGTYKGKKVSVMASGMGMPSMGIYSYELFNFYDVDNIIRVGSAGGTSKKVKIRDIVIGEKAFTKSSFAKCFGLGEDFEALATKSLVNKTVEIAKEKNLNALVGNIFSSDVFYGEESLLPYFQSNDILAVEMEAAALYMNAYKANKNALTICTISDSLITGESLSAKDRQESFDEMIYLALDLAVSLYN
ncbi:MAG TPA: purine-nucleoside phosphorylase [Clostridiales bacterium]|mgnify:FL=1|nr:purine-nucleoside phosphorylase [Clostridiales bacterium]